MYMLGFCLLAVVSGWIAWRNNPMFSARSTLRFILAAGLMLTVVIGMIIQVVRFGQHHSQTAAFSMMGAVVLFGTIAMIWVIVLISTPKSAPLPASVKMLYLHRRKVSMWAKRISWVVLAWALLMFALPRTPRIILGSIGGLFVFFGIVLWFTAYLTARQMDRWLSAIEAQPWVHWTYSADQWKEWTNMEVARTSTASTFQWRRDGHKLAWPILGVAVGVAIFSHGSWLYKSLSVAAIIIMLVSLIILGRNTDKNAPTKVRSQLVQVKPEAYFGQEGVFANGEFTPWITGGIYLLGAWMDERQPRSLVMQFCKMASNQTTTVDLSLPLPPGERVTSDLAKLQRELSARCPTATVRLTS
jgi:hypothetical protein